MALFSRQFDVATVAQLRELGVSAHAVSRARRAGLVVPVLRGTVGLASRIDRLESRVMAIQLATGGIGFASHTSAGQLNGFRRMRTAKVSYTLPEDRVAVVPTWVELHVTSWADDEPRPARSDPMVVASPLRTLFGLAGELGPRRFAQAAEDAWHLGLVDPAGAAEYLNRIRGRGRTGVARFEEWLSQIAPDAAPAESGLEQLLADLADQAGLPPPIRQYQLRLLSGRTIRLDLAWPELRWAVEPGHSWWHGGDRQLRADQERDRGCAELGWLITRFDETVWSRRRATIGELRRIYDERRAHFLEGRRSPASS